MKKFALFLSIWPILLLTNCDNDDDDAIKDVEAPVVKSITLNAESEKAVAQAGNSLKIAFELSDNQALGEIRMDIHSNFDGHAHGGRLAADPFTWEKIINLGEQKAFKDEITVDIPAEAIAGPYHFEAVVLDKAGNEAETYIADLTLTKEGQPVITVDSHNLEEEIVATPGTNLDLQGKITDDVDLAEISIEIAEEHDHDHDHGESEHHENEEPVYSIDIDLEGDNDTLFKLEHSIPLPADLAAGHYELMIKAMDSDGNITQIVGVLHVD
ncbi:DUF4625 domain-containing protein [Rapidithrix thailandica]|uniref:DUF4625 domain-containing protein n=1 Tax=Rapidithrix thailandica TaxID=413964 RepID=A0AAW9RSV8_9BACT